MAEVLVFTLLFPPPPHTHTHTPPHPQYYD